MKISTIASATITALAATKQVEAFVPNNPLQRQPQQRNIDPTQIKNRFIALSASGNNNMEDFSDFLGGNHDPEVSQAFSDIIKDDMPSLQKRIKNGLNPDTKFFNGLGILHLIALKGKDKHLNDDDQYLNVVKQLWLSGGDLDAKNDHGHTPLDYLESNQGFDLGDSVANIKDMNMKVSFNQNQLDAHLTTFSMQKEPTQKGKQWIATLVKGGANTEVMTPNGKRVIENIRTNWSSENSNAFIDLVVAAKFKSTANGLEKMPNRAYINDKWNNAAIAFYKAKGHE